MKFGHALQQAFALDPALTYLNHGTVGVPPWRVLNAQRALSDAIERNPSAFLLRDLAEVGLDSLTPDPPRMRRAAAEVARFVNARAEDLVFVDNATTGINAVLRSLTFAPGEQIAVTELGYGAIDHTAAFVARQHGVEVNRIPLPFAVESPDALVEAFAAGLAPEASVAVIDHICSASGMQWPIEAMIEVCRANRTAVLVDGAHAPGCIPLDVPAIGADWYVANLHKWALAPRSSAFLWAPAARQEGLHPVVISWGLDQGFTAEFDLVGTRDPTPHLVAPEGIAMLEEWGLDAVHEYIRGLVLGGVQQVIEAVGGEPVHPESMATCMASVRLPERFGTTFSEMVALRRRLLVEHRIEANPACREGRISLRLAAHVYNEASDFELLAEALKRCDPA